MPNIEVEMQESKEAKVKLVFVFNCSHKRLGLDIHLFELNPHQHWKCNKINSMYLSYLRQFDPIISIMDIENSL